MVTAPRRTAIRRGHGGREGQRQEPGELAEEKRRPFHRLREHDVQRAALHFLGYQPAAVHDGVDAQEQGQPRDVLDVQEPQVGERAGVKHQRDSASPAMPIEARSCSGIAFR